MPQVVIDRIHYKLIQAIEHIIEKDPLKWISYPVKYITSKDHSLFDKYKELIDKNLDYLITSMNDIGFWDVKHQGFQLENIFESTDKKEWTSFFSYENLIRLKEFNRIIE